MQPVPSCFWRRELWEGAGGVTVDRHLAMDVELWLAFEERAKLHVISETLSISKVHPAAKTTQNRHELYAERRRCAFAAAKRRGVRPSTIIARKLCWTVVWRVIWLVHRILGKRGKS